jgi:hypothetical protein
VLKQLISIGAAALLLAGCSGGGSVTPATKSAPAANAPASSQRVALNFEIDDTKPAANSRSPRFVSGGTTILGINVNSTGEIYYNVAAGSPNCNALTPRVCTVFVNATPGSGTFAFQTFGDTPTSGSETTQTAVPTELLAEGSASQTITAGTSNTLSVTLNGTPSTATLAPLSSFPSDGAHHSQSLAVTVKDAAGFTIVGTFDHQVTLSIAEVGGSGLSFIGPTGLSTLTSMLLNNATDTANVHVNYNGGGSGVYHAVITDNLSDGNQTVFSPFFIDQTSVTLAITTQSGGNQVGTSTTVTPSEFGATSISYGTTCDGTSGRAAVTVSPGSPLTGGPTFPVTITATAVGTACAVTYLDSSGSQLTTTVNVTSTSASITIPS